MWEYKVISEDKYSELAGRLNNDSNQSWELVSVVWQDHLHQFVMFLKRPRIKNTAPHSL